MSCCLLSLCQQVMLSTAAPLDSNAIKAQIYVWAASLANHRRAGISASAEPPVLCCQPLLSCWSLPALLPPFQNLCHGVVSWTLKHKDFFKAISLEFLKLWSRLSHRLETNSPSIYSCWKIPIHKHPLPQQKDCISIYTLTLINPLNHYSLLTVSSPRRV